MATLCLFIGSVARTQTAALKVGDKVPDIVLNNIINYKSTSLKLTDFKGKLLIIDFWATWCGSCIKKFPLLDSMQTVHGDKLQILLVNSKSSGDTEQKVRTLFEKRKTAAGANFNLPIALHDTTLKALFPHSTIPYYVWIGSGGKVIAITSSAGVSASTIHAALKNGSIPSGDTTRK